MNYFILRTDDLGTDDEGQLIEAIEKLGDRFGVNIDAGMIGDVLDPRMGEPVGQVAQDIGI